MRTAMTFNNKAMVFGSNSKWMVVNSYNPLDLPPYTIRCKFSSGYTPTMGDTQTLVDASANIWDIYKNDTNWNSLFMSRTQLVEVIAANITGVTSMNSVFYGCSTLVSMPLFDTSSVTNMSTMFSRCTSLKSVPLFDTSSVRNMAYMFNSCSNLTSVPLFNTSSVTNMSNMFQNCYAVESGALALYQQASTQASPPTSHSNAFTNCGRDTVTGAIELNQIPADWGGTNYEEELG